MKNTSWLLVTILVFSSCSHVSRYIASEPISPPEFDDLLLASKSILEDVGDAQFPGECVNYLKSLETKIDKIDVKSIPLAELAKDAEEIASLSWEIRSTLHSRLSEVDKDCALQMQSNFRQFRFIEDYTLELRRKVAHKTPSEIKFQEQPVPILDSTPDFYEARVNGELKFESGDLLITRGLSFMSAMIARLGKRATQFSHVVMVYKDPDTNQMKTIESYVGVGVAFYDLDFALKNENARILWLRAKDKKLANEAAKKMGELVKKRALEKNPIKYDYELNFDDPSTMSCAEVSQVGFQLVDSSFKIPFYPNEIIAGTSVAERLKLKAGATYEPGDMEIDPRFELIGEFQDLRLTRDSRQKDAIMTAVFDWMENKGYKLHDSTKSKMAGGVIYSVRRTFIWPLVKRVLGLDDFSKEIPRNMLSTVTLIGELGEEIHQHLKARDEAFEKTHGVPMSYLDFYQALEEIRQNDLKLYSNKKTKKQAKIHKLIRAD
ncbi:MAG: hypothetical protein K2P81_07855 [Bacteriovoracaceae bacterium]|nr:hypothetical protein [Bacteriovoracaceae bacterium]